MPSVVLRDDARDSPGSRGSRGPWGTWGTWVSPGSGRLAQPGLVALLALLWMPLVVLTTARTTVLDAGFYSQALNDADAYDRVYTEVLPDPAVDDLMAGLPIDSSLVTANLRTVLPPSTVQAMTDEQIDRIVDYLSADTDDIEFTVDLRPLFGSISGLANRYLAGELGTGSSYQVESVREFTQAVVDALDDIAAGRPPDSLPTMELSAQETDRVLDVVLDRLDPDSREALATPLRAQLRSGDLAGALALLGPVVFQGDEQTIEQLRASLADGALLDLGVRLSDLRDEPAINAVSRLHDVSAAMDWATIALFGAIGLTIVAILLVAAARGRSRVRAVGAALCIAGLAILALGAVLRLTLPNPLLALEGPSSSLPPGAGAVLADFSRHAYADIEGDYLRLVVWTLVVGTVVLGAHLLMAVSRRWNRASRRRRIALGFVGVTPVMLALTWATFPGAVANPRILCNNQPALCDRRYDEVTYLATHNAMASSEERFLGPTQDPSLVHQLDLGVRAMLLDVHHWTTSAEVDAFLATVPSSTRVAIEPLTRGARSQQPGLWLCHNLCQLGALNLTEQLRGIGAWMGRNPTEVVTLVIQDEVPASEIAGAVAAAGLAGIVVTPPEGARPWPTLGEMVDSGRRLVVFTENQDLPGTFLRSFYRYASDTPFSAASPEELTGCELERGSVDAALLLVNHWVTDAAPSRRAALDVNATEKILERAQRCEEERGRPPTLVAVDFVNIGHAGVAVDRLNGVA